jgi:hypothetical protein
MISKKISNEGNLNGRGAAFTYSVPQKIQKKIITKKKQKHFYLKQSRTIMSDIENVNKPFSPADLFRAAETSCLTERCNSSCISMQASNILCMWLIPC